MDPEHNRTSINTVNTEEDERFDRITAVATRWTLDFLFVSLCRSFRKSQLDEFNERLSTLEALCQCSCIKKDITDEKLMIAAFLSRVMHGEQLDVQFDEDEHVMPLMSAAKIWSKLQDRVADKRLFKNVSILLLVQSVAVCLEKGQGSSASSALKWFENNHECPRNLRVKLSAIVTQKKTYHPFLMSFSFKRLLETIQDYLDAFLEKNPCDYLLKEATKMVQSSQNGNCLENDLREDSSLSEEEKVNTRCMRRKRKLLPTKMTDPWKPDTCKKSYVSVKRLSKTESPQKRGRPLSEISRLTSEMTIGTSVLPKTRKPPQKWTQKLDRYLKAGVDQHGQGKWAQILKDYDFEGRTGTMLKDRWRVLIRAHKVG